ncbi:MAG: hypothetical protein ABIE74_05330 [Pseudomonadota bacterium]
MKITDWMRQIIYPITLDANDLKQTSFIGSLPKTDALLIGPTESVGNSLFRFTKKSNEEWVKTASPVFKRHNAKISIDSEDGLITVENDDYTNSSNFILNESFLKLKELNRVESLDLTNVCIGDEEVKALAGCPYLTGLKKLNLFRNEISNKGVLELSKSPLLARLVSLRLDWNNIGNLGASALAATSTLSELSLGCNSIGNKGAISLAFSPYFRCLRELDLWYNRIADKGIIALTKSPHLERLTDLNLDQNRMGDKGEKAYRRWEILRDVRFGCEGSTENLVEYLKEDCNFLEKVRSIRAQYRSNVQIARVFHMLSSSGLLTTKEKGIILDILYSKPLSWRAETEEGLFI